LNLRSFQNLALIAAFISKNPTRFRFHAFADSCEVGSYLEWSARHEFPHSRALLLVFSEWFPRRVVVFQEPGHPCINPDRHTKSMQKLTKEAIFLVGISPGSQTNVLFNPLALAAYPPSTSKLGQKHGLLEIRIVILHLRYGHFCFTEKPLQ